MSSWKEKPRRFGLANANESARLMGADLRTHRETECHLRDESTEPPSSADPPGEREKSPASKRVDSREDSHRQAGG